MSDVCTFIHFYYFVQQNKNQKYLKSVPNTLLMYHPTSYYCFCLLFFFKYKNRVVFYFRIFELSVFDLILLIAI